MKRLCYWGVLKEGFSAYLTLVMLISRKVTQDKIVVNRFQAFKCNNSQQLPSISLTRGYIFGIRKF